MKKEMEDYLQFCYPGTHSKAHMLQIDKNVCLRVIHFTPVTPSIYPPVVMVVGLATYIEGFQSIVAELTRDFEVYYIETREKSSSKLSGTVRFDMETIAGDIIFIIKVFRLNLRQYILFGYSYGATVLSEAYCHLESKPSCLLLLSPTPSFYYPRWSLPLIRIAVPFYKVIKPTAKWYLRNFVINRKEDNEMYLFTSHTLDRADPWKLKNAILAVAGHEFFEKLESIDSPTLIIDTSRDGFHRNEDIRKMVKSIKGSTYIDLETNKRTHSPEIGRVIRGYINGLPVNGPGRIE
jgi:pimeloyl-ACP methyl ester carboxylesterase